MRSWQLEVVEVYASFQIPWYQLLDWTMLLFWLFVLLTSKPCKSNVVSDQLRTFYLVKTETEHHAADYALCLGKSVVHMF